MVLAAHDFGAAAYECYTIAEQWDPRDRRWPYFRAVYLAQVDPQAAVSLFRRTIDLSSQELCVEPRFRLADTLLQLQQPEEARKYYAEVLDIRSDFLPAHLGMGKLLFSQGDWKGCLPYLERASKGPHTRKLACRLLSLAYSRLAAAAARNNGSSANPEVRIWKIRMVQAQHNAKTFPDDLPHPDSLLTEIEKYAVGRTYRMRHVDHLISLHRFREAAAILQDLLKQYPEDSWLHYCLGNALGRQKKIAEAKKAFKKALAIKPQMVQPHFMLGMTALLEAEEALRHGRDSRGASRHFREAETYFRKVVRLKRDHAPAYNRLGYCCLVQNKPSEGLDYARKALVCQPEDIGSRLLLADLLLRVGEDAQAFFQLSQTISRIPDLKDQAEPQLSLCLAVGRSLLWK
jgi:tetratricopeptide (TPR) repeat protein